MSNDTTQTTEIESTIVEDAVKETPAQAVQTAPQQQKFQLPQRGPRPPLPVQRPQVSAQPPAPVIVKPSHVPSPALAALKEKLDNETYVLAERIDQEDPSLLIQLTAIGEYVSTMRPGVQVKIGEGVREQIKLYRALVATLKQTGPIYVYLLNAVLGLFRQHREGALSWAYMNRFMEEITLSQPERKLFTAMTMIMSELCVMDMTERQSRAKKIFNSPHVATLVSVLSEEDAQRLRQAMRVE
jgi:hypothetical protein